MIFSLVGDIWLMYLIMGATGTGSEIMWATRTGSEAMKRIAAPMVGGMVSSTVLTLVVIPAIYALWKGWELRQEKIVAEIELRTR